MYRAWCAVACRRASAYRDVSRIPFRFLPWQEKSIIISHPVALLSCWLSLLFMYHRLVLYLPSSFRWIVVVFFPPVSFREYDIINRPIFYSGPPWIESHPVFVLFSLFRSFLYLWIICFSFSFFFFLLHVLREMMTGRVLAMYDRWWRWNGVQTSGWLVNGIERYIFLAEIWIRPGLNDSNNRGLT